MAFCVAYKDVVVIVTFCTCMLTDYKLTHYSANYTVHSTTKHNAFTTELD